MNIRKAKKITKGVSKKYLLYLIKILKRGNKSKHYSKEMRQLTAMSKEYLVKDAKSLLKFSKKYKVM